MTGAYYNEIDPKAAAWLRELINKGHIAPGEVDERSIVDIAPSEIQDFSQVHFFAGIGVWSYALRLAGWEDHRGVWTGSCPCQPFSQAGKGAGTADDRHLWPYWEHLIRELRPSVIFGEQVASRAADSWADLVQDDLEALDYAFGAVPFPAASVGAPHIRDRLYWVAHNPSVGRGQERADGRGQPSGDRTQGLSAGLEPGGSSGGLADDARRIEHAQRDGEPAGGLEAGQSGRDAGRRSELGDTGGAGSGRDAGAVLGAESCAEWRLRRELDFALAAGATDGCLEDSELPASARLGQHGRQSLREQKAVRSAGASVADSPDAGRHARVLCERTPWSAADFVWCRDGKWRPVEPGSFPLAHGAPARVGRLRGYGNAIVSEAAKIFIEASGLV